MEVRSVTFAALILVALSVTSHADDAQQTFDSLFGAKLKQVKASVDRDDDAALANSFIDTAQQTTGTPKLAAILYAEAFALTRVHEPAVALKAMRLLAANSQGDREDASEKIVDLLTVMSRTGDAASRNSAADELIAIYTQQGDAAFGSNDMAKATVAYRKALILAARRQHASADALRDRIKTAADRARTIRQVEQLEQALLRDADNQSALKELTLMYLLDLQQPSNAARYSPRIKDESLQATLQLALKDDATLSAADSLALGEDYAAIMKQSEKKRELVAGAYAVRYLRQYMTLEPKAGLSRTKAEILIKQIDAKVDISRVTLPSKASGGADGTSPTPPGTLPIVKFTPPEKMMQMIHLTMDDAANGETLKDSKGVKRNWTMKGVVATPGVSGNASAFAGDGGLIVLSKATSVNLVSRHMTIAAWIRREKSTGVIFAVGGHNNGYALHIADDHLAMTVRVNETYHETVSTEKLPNGWVHVAVDLRINGTITLYVNGKKAGEGKANSGIRRRASEGISLGSDVGVNVGRYGNNEHYKGAIDEFQLWTGK